MTMAEDNYPQALEAVIAGLRRLPGVGRRTAERIALSMLDWPLQALADLGEQIATLQETVTPCPQCGYFAEKNSLCRICSSQGRNCEQICVVEESAQVAVIEASGGYRGLYHVLGGRLMPLDGKGPEDLRIELLHRRLEDGTVKELILAMGSDVEGEATATFMAMEFASSDITITRIATGVPVGADLSYADAATVAAALSRRRPLE
jgi:recombination protein RecR